MTRYPRDLIGYGATPPDPKWPGGAALAVQFVVNYEEGGENCLLHGDPASEAFLSEVVGAQPWPDQRHWNIETMYEYGARSGFWRLHRMFTERRVPVTVYGVATALARGPEQVAAMLDADWEIASHAMKWIEYKDYSRAAERAEMEATIRLHTEVTGSRPLGWYTGRCSINTVDLVAEEGGFLYAADSYADELPYWHDTGAQPQLIVPYTLDANDMRFATPQGFNSGDQFFAYLRDTFDVLYAEGLAGRPVMMSVGLHCRLAGRPGRAAALARFLDHVLAHDRVWCARRVDIARHWQMHHPYVRPDRPSRMDRAAFVARFGSVYEHSPWVAERAYDLALGPAHDTPAGLANALARVFRSASEAERLAVLEAHPDLGPRVGAPLTDASAAEQTGAGLDALDPAQRARFVEMNEAYRARFGIPFIVAVKGLDADAILSAFAERLAHDGPTELARAAAEVEKIARFRLDDLVS